MHTPVHEYLVTKSDFLDAQRLHRRNRPWTALNYWTFHVVVPIVGAICALYTGWLWIQGGSRAAGAWIPPGVLGLYFAILPPLVRWNQIRRLWNNAQPKKYRDRPIQLQFDEEQVISSRPGESEGRFFWNAFEDYVEDEKLALLYVRRKLFLFIPRRAMPEDEWQRFRALALPRKVSK